MELVLLSGGSGKRLWPLSNDARSKQFLKVLEDKNGVKQSMVQRVWTQIAANNLTDHTTIATSNAQVDILNSQINERINIVVEPERRDTYPAIALASVFLYSIKNVSLDETVCMLPVDSYVEDKFFTQVTKLEEVLISSNSELALLGVKPTFPSTKYGYIVPEGDLNLGEYLNVDYFKEKPSIEIASELIKENALWNCGVFAFKLRFIIDSLIEKGLPIDYIELKARYDELPKNSFDYEMVEKTKKITVLPYDGDWKDLGTWNTLTEEMASNITGKGIISDGVKNSNIINELDIPITLLGIDDVIVAASPDGILVTDKDNSPKVKDYVSGIDGRPMYEERRWGHYKVLDHTKFPEGNEVLTKRIGIGAGKNLSYQVHYNRSEVWTIVKGEGILILDGIFKHVRSGDVIEIPLATKHSIKAVSEIEIIEVQTGSQLIEEDVVRLATEWEDIQIYGKETGIEV
ncbi:sugar phosphate nucleotidyltransferase [Terribacillus sp. AE2B 122]|uniref:sugar phosphate nucleotidyltransferase n=1 Tax=Terribacillus sp. AE2B 122 TaxID=1331902 RepID=UPI001582692A|nr:sugar phosphate nucleotidyltransferase [Terribacillus sp. AE2B 122]